MKSRMFWIWIVLLCLIGGIFAPSVLANVTITDFYAVAEVDAITVYWETASETNNLGFYLWRSLDENEGYQIISGFIPSQDEGAGALYEYEDTDVTPGTIYYYALQDVPDDGSSGDFTGPLEVDTSLLFAYKVFLPLVRKN